MKTVIFCTLILFYTAVGVTELPELKAGRFSQNLLRS